MLPSRRETVTVATRNGVCYRREAVRLPNFRASGFASFLQGQTVYVQTVYVTLGDDRSRRRKAVGVNEDSSDDIRFIGPLDEPDANRDDALSGEEVPEGLWDRLVEADADAGDSVTKDELQAYREAERVAAAGAFFEQLDRDASGTITSADVSRLTWRFLSRADADNDGAVTIDELLAVPLPGRWSCT